MSNILENNLPYKVYSATNMGVNEGMFYLGKVPNNLTFQQKVFSDDYYKNCLTGYYFSIASLIPGSCIRMDIADESDPSILIDAKWFDFRDCGHTNECGVFNESCIISQVEYNETETVPHFKSLTTDGTVVLNGGSESGFLWNDEGLKNNSIGHCAINLQAPKYVFKNIDEPGAYYDTIGTPGETNVIFLMRSLVGGNNIRVTDYGTQLAVEYIRGCESDDVDGSSNITCSPYIPSNVGQFI